jgi:hypothetical protein
LGVGAKELSKAVIKKVAPRKPKNRARKESNFTNESLTRQARP